MKLYSRINALFFALTILFGAAGAVHAQKEDNSDYRNYAFVVFETTVTKKGVETSDSNPAERRFYISGVVEFPERDRSIFRNAFKIADAYFIANVSGPLEAKGIVHKYYDDAITINNKASYLETREDVEKLREKVLADLKERNANVFTFNWTRDENANGLETSQPTLVHRGAEQPLYGAPASKSAETKPNVSAAPIQKPSPKPAAKKTKRN